MCAHIRITTTGDDYLKRDNRSANEFVRILNLFPANEITIILDVLSKGDGNPFNSAKFDLRRVYLKHALLRDANLKSSRLFLSNLNGAFLDNADLSDAKLGQADLSGAWLRNTGLTDADLESAKLTGAYLKGTKLIGTQLKSANLEGSYSRGAGSPGDQMETRIGKFADLTGCIFSDDELTDLRDVSCGVLTQGLYDAIMKDQNTGKTENEDRYRKEHYVKRQPTPKEQEQLVGKDNVDKCNWGDIWVLGEKGV